MKETLKRIKFVAKNEEIELPEPIEIEVSKITRGEKGLIELIKVIVEKWKETYKRLSQYEKED